MMRVRKNGSTGTSAEDSTPEYAGRGGVGNSEGRNEGLSTGVQCVEGVIENEMKAVQIVLELPLWIRRRLVDKKEYEISR